MRKIIYFFAFGIAVLMIYISLSGFISVNILKKSKLAEGIVINNL